MVRLLQCDPRPGLVDLGAATAVAHSVATAWFLWCRIPRRTHPGTLGSGFRVYSPFTEPPFKIAFPFLRKNDTERAQEV